MRALITGITGFAGSHLADYLLAEQPHVEVFGTRRWRSRMENIRHLEGKVTLVETDLSDATSALRTLERVRPDYVFHLAAQIDLRFSGLRAGSGPITIHDVLIWLGAHRPHFPHEHTKGPTALFLN